MNKFLLVIVMIAVPAQGAAIDRVMASLKATTTMTADFVQTAADGRQQAGKLWLERPGRIRFQYTKSPILIVANGSRLSFVDYEVRQVSQWPVGSTPLGVLIDSRADLTRFARVTVDTGAQLRLEARDPKHPEFGAITLAFADDATAPGNLALLGWSALDAQSNLTEIRLANVRYNIAVPRTRFSFRDPRTTVVPGKSH